MSFLRRLVAVLAHDTRHRARAEVTPATLTYFSPTTNEAPGPLDTVTRRTTHQEESDEHDAAV